MGPLTEHGFYDFEKENAYVNKQDKSGPPEKGSLSKKILGDQQQPTSAKLHTRQRSMTAPEKSVKIPVQGLKEVTVKVSVEKKNAKVLKTMKFEGTLVADYVKAIKSLKDTDFGTFKVWKNEDGSIGILQHLPPREISPGDVMVLLATDNFEKDIPLKLEEDKKEFNKEYGKVSKKKKS